MKNVNCPVAALGEIVVKKLTRSEAKRVAIIDAARDVFLSKGFDIASMDMIAAEANVSKKTVYSHFKSKENLFIHIMQGMCSSKRESIIDGSGLNTSNVLRMDRPIEDALIELGQRLLQQLYDPKAIALLRILIGQAENFPENGIEYFNQGPKEIFAVVGQYLIEADKAGIVSLENPTLAAKVFLSSMLSSTYLKCLTTACPPPDEKEINQIVEASVHLFLYGAISKK